MCNVFQNLSAKWLKDTMRFLHNCILYHQTPDGNGTRTSGFQLKLVIWNILLFECLGIANLVCSVSLQGSRMIYFDLVVLHHHYWIGSLRRAPTLGQHRRVVSRDTTSLSLFFPGSHLTRDSRHNPGIRVVPVSRHEVRVKLSRAISSSPRPSESEHSL